MSDLRQPLISVVIPTRNRCDFLRQAVNSVCEQSLPDWELVVVDDASEDGTWAWLQSLSDPRIRCLQMTQRSEQSATRNAGVRQARGSIIISLDDDDLLAPQALAKHGVALRRYPRAIASVGGYVAFDAEGAQRPQRVVRRQQVRELWHDVLFGWIATAGQTAFRAQALGAVDHWDESWNRVTDHELWSRIGHLGPVVLLPDIVLRYRVHAGQWRPENLDELVTRARQIGVAAAPEPLRAAGRETLAIRGVAQQAFEAFLDARAGRALRLYAQVLRRRPEVLRSPLTRPMVLLPMVKCLVGSRGIKAGRRLLDRLDRVRRRNVDFSVRGEEPPDGERSNGVAGGNSGVGE